MLQPWQISVAQLSLSGRQQEAIGILKDEIARGNLAALVSLARRYNDAGLTHGQATDLIAKVEREMNPSDWVIHLELAAAYDQRLGAIPYEEKARRNLEHVEEAARLGAGAIHCLAAARIWRTGALGVEPNAAKAASWYRRAIEAGSAEAETELRRVGL